MSKRTPMHKFRDQLIVQEKRSNELYTKYKMEVGKMIDRESKALRKQKWITLPIYVYLVLLATAFLTIGGYLKDPTMKLWFGLIACFMMIVGAIIFLALVINRARVEMLKEMKEIQLRIIELQDKIESKTQVSI
jgi:hypothetical protein